MIRSRGNAYVFTAQIWIRLDQSAEDASQLGLRRRRRGIWREATEQLEIVAAALRETVWREPHRHPDIGAQNIPEGDLMGWDQRQRIG